MSYRCDNCSKIREGSELKRIAEVREVTYNRSFLRFDRREKKKIAKFTGSFTGTECVKEERLCEKCYNDLKDNPPKIVNRSKRVDFVGQEKRREDKRSDNDKGIDLKGLKNKLENRR